MTNNLQVNNQEVNYIDSLEVAEMTGKRHADLLRDIENYKSVLENAKLRFQNFFVESSYKTSGNNKTYKSYLLTRKGCELVANKMTGEKGVLFTVAYIDRFHEMEKAVQQPTLPTTYKEALLQLVEQVEATEKLQAQLDEQAPAIEYHNKVLSIEGFMTIDETAKELGLRSAQQLNQMLKDKGVIKRSGRGSWLHRAGYEYLKDGYINYKPIEKKKLQMLVSQKGVKEFARLLDLI
ncbi:Rha family transcriptional regulator [Bacillus thuringiensis]|uniref:Rha family transcriptional regulator n=1 Tax=Bacillus thuringiensis TaxID=1428 RepID=UPI000BEC59BD|nr:Rha family transcriptional regulator [Bacillus thuringiensis]PDZ88977.1 Rha family transcriptional regulator [Bacillus thuringiensis]